MKSNSGGWWISSCSNQLAAFGSVRSHPCYLSMKRPRKPNFSTSGIERGGQKTSTTAYFFPAGFKPLDTWCLIRLSCFLDMPPFLRLSGTDLAAVEANSSFTGGRLCGLSSWLYRTYRDRLLQMLQEPKHSGCECSHWSSQLSDWISEASQENAWHRPCTDLRSSPLTAPGLDPERDATCLDRSQCEHPASWEQDETPTKVHIPSPQLPAKYLYDPEDQQEDPTVCSTFQLVHFQNEIGWPQHVLEGEDRPNFSHRSRNIFK